MTGVQTCALPILFFGFVMGLGAVDATLSDVAWRLLIAVPIVPALIRLQTTKNVFPYH